MVGLDYFCFFAAIAYALIFYIVNIVMCQVTSESWKVEMSEIFVPDCEGEFVTLRQMYFLLHLLIDVILDFDEVVS